MYLSTSKCKYLLALAIAGLGLWGQAMAHGPDVADHRRMGPRASLNAQASAELPQDTVQITLAADLVADSQVVAAEALNTRLDTVMKDAKGQTGIQVRSGSYRVWPTTNQDGQVAQWRGRAEIILTSSDFVAASRLAAQLGDRMPIAGLAFSVSDKARAAAEQKLLVQAVDAFKARAQALTEALGFASYRLGSIDLGGQGEVAPMPRMMMAKAADSMVAAPMEGGTETVSVSVNGTILLQLASTAARQ